LYRAIGTQSFALGGVLYAALIGNLLSVIFNSFYESSVRMRLAIYRSTQSAITVAQQQKAPLFVTPDIALPDLIVHKVPFLENMSADAILRTYPAYDAAQALPVYSIADTTVAQALLPILPGKPYHAIVGNGFVYHFIYR
jgi:hypothetical protein